MKNPWSKKARTFVNKFKYHGARSVLRLTGKLRPEAAAAWGEQLFLTPSRLPLRHHDEKLLKRASQGSVQVGKDLLRVWHWGRGPKILLIHGWSGRGSQFSAWVDVLVEAGFRVTILDAPAHGNSTGNTASLYQFVQAIEETERQYGPFEAIVGHSLGGAAVLSAVARGLAVKQLVTIGTPGDIETVMSRAFQGKMGLEADVQKLIIERLEQHYVPVKEVDPKVQIQRIKQPVLVIHDLDDTEIPWSEASALSQSARYGELLTTKGLGHTRILRDVGVIMKVRDFLTGINPQPLESPLMTLLMGETDRY